MIENPTLYNCSTCSLPIETDVLYKEHFKSEFHRYNLKRKLINLPAATVAQYDAQFDQSTNKSASQSDLRCEICSKAFLSANTYKHHINSVKHKKSREQLLKKESNLVIKKSKSASSSEFSVLSCDSELKHETCIFCKKQNSNKHFEEHNFPPFKESCIDIKGLTARVNEIIKSGHCAYCSAAFQNQEAAKQHMEDVGHAMLNTEKLEQFSQFYVWIIHEEAESEEDETEVEARNIPLNKIQDYYKSKIERTPYGAKIKGRREIGVRRFRRYYKQYYREVAKIDRTPCDALENTPESTIQVLHTFGKRSHNNFTQIPKRVNKAPPKIRKGY